MRSLVCAARRASIAVVSPELNPQMSLEAGHFRIVLAKVARADLAIDDLAIAAAFLFRTST